ncbi:hypothetical protein [Oceaniglobus roseus]|uniref:hypothetical protein n=1 Tax=Oceaniglobus roseus TaxID=1737570 RepID=UPI0012FFD525|nr:hypothetical protein [Kandeliimicrobium roseum]
MGHKTFAPINRVLTAMGNFPFRSAAQPQSQPLPRRVRISREDIAAIFAQDLASRPSI